MAQIHFTLLNQVLFAESEEQIGVGTTFAIMIELPTAMGIVKGSLKQE